jgi:capsular polysaccharide biosynthesis protein
MKSAAKTASLPMQKSAAKTASLPIMKSAAKTESSFHIYIYIYFLLGVYISPSMCMHHILLEDNVKPTREMQRRLNPPMMEVVKAEILKLLDASHLPHHR